jgi:hypothetical protein
VCYNKDTKKERGNETMTNVVIDNMLRQTVYNTNTTTPVDPVLVGVPFALVGVLVVGSVVAIVLVNKN